MTFSTRGCFSRKRGDRPWRCCNGAPCAAPGSSARAAPGSCRRARRWRRWRSAGRSGARARSAFSPTTSTPPTMSEWPFRYLVAECMTMSKPCSMRPLHPGAGEGVVADGDDAALARQRRPAPRGRPASAAGWSASRPRSCGSPAGSPPRSAARSVRSTKLKSSPAERSPHPLEQPPAAAIEIVHGDDMIAAVEQLQRRGGRRHAGGEGEAGGAALQIGDAALIGVAGRVLAARILVALVHARALLDIGRGRVDRHHDRAGRRDRATGRHGWCGWRSRGGCCFFMVASSGHAAAQMVQQIDAGDEAQELAAVHDEGDVVAARRSAAGRRAAGRPATVSSRPVMAPETGSRKRSAWP